MHEEIPKYSYIPFQSSRVIAIVCEKLGIPKIGLCLQKQKMESHKIEN